jgi:hypothetical protein
MYRVPTVDSNPKSITDRVDIIPEGHARHSREIIALRYQRSAL